MTTQIVRVGNTLTVEIPEELVAQASLPVGEPLEWVSNGNGSIALVKQSTSTRPRKRRHWRSFWKVFQRELVFQSMTGALHAGLRFGEALLP